MESLKKREGTAIAQVRPCHGASSSGEHPDRLESGAVQQPHVVEPGLTYAPL